MGTILELFVWVLGCLFSPFVELVANRVLGRFNTSFFDPPSSRLRAALPGHWVGSGQQTIVPEGYSDTLAISMDLKWTLGKLLKGTAVAEYTHHGQPQVARFVIAGGSCLEHVIKLDYRNTSLPVLQLGTIILELDPEGRKLTGQLVGYGDRSGEIVHVNVKLERPDTGQSKSGE